MDSSGWLLKVIEALGWFLNNMGWLLDGSGWFLKVLDVKVEFWRLQKREL